VIYIGIDDTDAAGTPGTNHLARALAVHVSGRWACRLIVRHQLLFDPRVPYTSKNSSASLLFEADERDIEPLVRELREVVRRRSFEGSDPGLCAAATVPAEIGRFGLRCQQDLVTQEEARGLAAGHGMYLEGLGGSEDGVIGALAAVGLAAEGNDGRVVQIGAWPDDLCGCQSVPSLEARGVQVECVETGEPIRGGSIDVGKHLRPNYRGRRVVLFARPDGTAAGHWQAVRFT
jgi:hypothetical protein